jgi:glycosyltransferase involved in cell wall biosynthesis
MGINDEKLKVIYNGIDYGLFDPKKADGSKIREELKIGDEFIYMYFGRPGITKGIEYLINAVPLISKKIHNSKLLLILANDPNDRYKKIVKMIDDLNIKHKIILLDPVPRKELPNYIAASDCVVVPSLSEGFGFTAAEACAMEKPVVATDVASLPEVVFGRYALVEPRNPEGIAEGVLKVYRGEVEDKGKKIYDWDECVGEYLEIYQGLIGK